MLEQKVVEILAALQKLVEQQGPAALVLGLHVIHIEAVFDIVFSTVLLLLLFIVARVMLRWWKKDLDNDEKETEMIARIFGSIFSVIGATVIIINFMVVWFSVRTWMALLDPRLALAYDILKRVANQK